MRIILTILLLFFSASVFAEQLKFVQITDTHLSTEGSNYGGRVVEESVQTLESAVESINKIPDLDFVVFSGDNIDVAQEDQLIKFCEITKNLNKPYYIGIGNHDVFSNTLNKTNYFKIVKQYNKNQKSNEPEFYFFPNKDFIVIFMDGAIQMIPSNHGSFNDQDLEWLDEVLTKYENKKAIIVQHFPLVEPSENKSHRTRNPMPYNELLERHSNVIAIVSGHYHCEKVTEKDGIFHISSPALVGVPHQYRIIEIDYDPKTLSGQNPAFDLKTEIIPVELK